MFNQAEKDGILVLSDDDRATIENYEAAPAVFYKNIVANDEEQKALQKEFGKSEVTQKMTKIYEHTGVADYYIQMEALLPIRSVMGKLNSIGVNDNMKDLLLASKLCRSLDKSRKPLTEDALEIAKKNIRIPMMLNIVLREDKKYRDLTQKESKIKESVKKVSEELKGLNEGEQIIWKIIESHKDKLVLPDVWGTWCSPCKAAISHSQEEYERLNKYGIAYVLSGKQLGRDRLAECH